VTRAIDGPAGYVEVSKWSEARGHVNRSRTPAVMLAGGVVSLALIVLGATRGPTSGDEHAGAKAPAALVAHSQPR